MTRAAGERAICSGKGTSWGATPCGVPRAVEELRPKIPRKDEDLFEEAVLKVWTGLAAGEPYAASVTGLLAITTCNLTIDQARHEGGAGKGYVACQRCPEEVTPSTPGRSRHPSFDC